MANSPLNRRRAFTAVEIIVVIGVIMLLAALLFPVLSRVREGGRAKSCSNNLRQLGMAFTEYRRDWGERFPYAGSFTKWDAPAHWVRGVGNAAIGSLTSDPGLIPAGCESNPATCNKADVESGSIYPYVKQKDIYICPSNVEGKTKQLSYSMNCALARMAENRIKEPSAIVLLVDEDTANDGFFFASNTADASLTWVYGVVHSTDLLTKKHNGGGNLLFVDGHVDFYPFDAFPLDGNTTGLQNKGRMSGTPRFHDISFGKHGSYMPPPDPSMTPPQVDACGVLP